MAPKAEKSRTLLTLPLEVCHRIFEFVFERTEGAVLLIKQQLEHLDADIDTDDADELYDSMEYELSVNVPSTAEDVPADWDGANEAATQDGQEVSEQSVANTNSTWPMGAAR